MEKLSTAALIKIAENGGSITMSSHGRAVGEIIRVLIAGEKNGAALTLTNATELTVPQLVRISQAGVGRVTFQ